MAPWLLRVLPLAVAVLRDGEAVAPSATAARSGRGGHGGQRNHIGRGSSSSDTDGDAGSQLRRRRQRLGMVTVISAGSYLERDRDSIALMNCFSLRHGVPYFVEPHHFGDNWYNKQHALLKYLEHFEWVLYVDADTYVVDRERGFRALLTMTERLDAGGYHVAMAELHHSGVGGFDAGVMLLKNSPTTVRFLREWLDGKERSWRNADNGFLNILFLRWVLGRRYDGACDHHLYKNYVRNRNGTTVAARESSKDSVNAYYGFFPCFYGALGLPWAPYAQMRMRKLGPAGEDARAAWRPFYIMHWDEVGVLSCAYPRRVTSRMSSSAVPCREPIVYHAKDAVSRYWNAPSGPNVTNGRCI